MFFSIKFVVCAEFSVVTECHVRDKVLLECLLVYWEKGVSARVETMNASLLIGPRSTSGSTEIRADHMSMR